MVIVIKKLLGLTLLVAATAWAQDPNACQRDGGPMECTGPHVLREVYNLCARVAPYGGLMAIQEQCGWHQIGGDGDVAAKTTCYAQGVRGCPAQAQSPQWSRPGQSIGPNPCWWGETRVEAGIEVWNFAELQGWSLMRDDENRCTIMAPLPHSPLAVRSRIIGCRPGWTSHSVPGGFECRRLPPPPDTPLGCASGAGGFFVCPPPSAPPPAGSGPGSDAGAPGGASSGGPAGPSGPPAGSAGDGGGGGGAWGGGWGGGGGGCRRADEAGNPIFTGTGNKYQRETDYLAPSGLRLERHYNSSLPGWVHNWSARIWADAGRARVIRPDGRSHDFTGSGPGAWAGPAHLADRLTRLAASDASGALWRYSTGDDAAEWYDAQGRLMRVVLRNGQTFTAGYAANGLLQQVTDPFGRRLQFAYDASGRLQQVTTPEGTAIRYGYDAQGRLAGVTAPNGTQRIYLYEDARWPGALTGLVDERGQRIATWAYDDQGRAVASEGPGGINRWRLQFGGGGAVSVTDPLGTTRAQQFVNAGGKRVFAGQSQPCVGCAGDALSMIVDPLSGLVSQRTDHAGVVSQTQWDSSRHLPLSQTRAVGRPEAHTRQTQWHPVWRLPVRDIEPGRATEYEYDSQGNLIARTVTDTASGARRIWRWSYNAQGLAISMTDPRGAVWTWSYDAQGNRVLERNPLGHETRWEHDAAGRPIRETDPGGLVTTYTWDARGRLTEANRGGDITRTQYNADGTVASLHTPDGLRVDYEYDAAGRLVAARDSTGARLSLQLDAAGNRVREELRDTSGAVVALVQRGIDPLGRVVTEADALGQTTHYGWDPLGQLERSTDPLNHSTRWQRDGLRRVVATVFADNSQALQAWDQLDGLRQVTDPIGVLTRYERNAFGEVLRETSPDAGEQRHEYDAGGQLLRSTDARGVVSDYQRDALGRILRITRTPPAGLDLPVQQVRFIWDGQRTGHLARIEDASGATDYERDAHGRITRKTQTVRDNPAAPTQLSIRYEYERGQLAAITYPSGLKLWFRRDASGRITAIDAQAPGGSARNPRPIVPIASELRWSALGQPQSWRWFNGAQAQRRFDAAGRMTDNEFASYRFDAAGHIIGITQHLWAQATDTGTTGATTLTVPLEWHITYDARGRITAFERDGHSQRYEWDANGNRLLASQRITSDSDLDGELEASDLTRTQQQHTLIGQGSNQLLGFTQTTSRIRGSRTTAQSQVQIRYSLDAAGNLTHDGLRQFDYGPDNRLWRIRISRDGEAAQVTYLTNALGQRVFAGEPRAEQSLPDEDSLGEDFITWLRRTFGWLFGRAQSNTSLGSAFVFGDGPLPPWAVLGEYDNGSASGKGRTEYIWLPTADGAIPIAIWRNNKFFSIHGDHLGTPRQMRSEANQVLWQWPYSAFGDNPPSGLLKATAKPNAAITHQPLLKATKPPQALDLRFAGQYADAHAGQFYNLHRMYMASQGRYTQADPIGLDGGLNRFLYAEGDALMSNDPDGLSPFYPETLRCIPGWPCTPRGPMSPPIWPVCCDQVKLRECLLNIDPLAAADLAKCAGARDKQSCVLALLEVGKVSACFVAHCKKSKGDCECK